MSKNPEVVIARVREVIGDQTQIAFAQKAGIDPVKLSKSLHGTRRFTSLDLALIAEAGGVRVDWLMGMEPPIAEAVRSAVAAGDDSYCVAMAGSYVELREQFADPGEAHPWRDVEPVRLTGTWQDQGHALARSALALLDQHRPAAGLDLAGILEQVYGVDVAIEPDDGYRSVAAASETVRLVVAAQTANWREQRRALAHGLGALLAGDDTRIHADHRGRLQGTGRESEIRADAFAETFLAGIDGRGVAAPAGSEGQRIAAAMQHRVPRAILRDVFAAYQRGETTLRGYLNLFDPRDEDRLRYGIQALQQEQA